MPGTVTDQSKRLKGLLLINSDNLVAWFFLIEAMTNFVTVSTHNEFVPTLSDVPIRSPSWPDE